MKNFFLPILVVAAFVASANVVKIDLPVETASYKNAPGVEFANAQCLTCHSVDYTEMQPPKPRDFWKAEVEKMIGKYGAPIPDDQTNALINYFATTYGTEKDVATTAVSAVKSTTGGINAKELALKNGCLNCHNSNIKIVGPAYKDVAAKYAGNPGATDAIIDQITHGGAGKWGPMPMPPFKQFSKEELKALSDWILSLK